MIRCDWCLRPLVPEGMEYDAAEKPDRYCWGDGDLLCDEVHEMDAWPRVTRENERLRGLLGGTLPDAQVLSPLSVRPVDASAGQPAPMLICPACGMAWPELTPGDEDTVTCQCGRVLGCRVRR